MSHRSRKRVNLVMRQRLGLAKEMYRKLDANEIIEKKDRSLFEKILDYAGALIPGRRPANNRA